MYVAWASHEPLRAAFKCYSASTYFIKIPHNTINTTLTPSVWKIPHPNLKTQRVFSKHRARLLSIYVCCVLSFPMFRNATGVGPIRKLRDTCGELEWQWWKELARNPVSCQASTSSGPRGSIGEPAQNRYGAREKLKQSNCCVKAVVAVFARHRRRLEQLKVSDNGWMVVLFVRHLTSVTTRQFG